jgi:toxin ParE1/3/4
VRVVFAPAAKADLIEIGQRDSQDAAGESELVNSLIDACYSLTDHPRRCPLIPRYEGSGIRRLVHKQYLVFFRIKEDAIEIVRVLYGGRDWQTLLFPED